MKAVPGDSWTPTRELLAAFVDGELDRRPDLADLRRQIEAWLAAHPEANAELDAQVELSSLMAATTPPEPAAEAWARVWSRIEKAQPHGAKRRSAAAWLAGLVAVGTAAAVLLVVLQQASDKVPEVRRLVSGVKTPEFQLPSADSPLPTPDSRLQTPDSKGAEVFPVATEEEVEIISVAGADTHTVVAGQLPLLGTIVLLQPHEVEFQTPANGDARTAHCITGDSSVIVWTPLPSETREDQ